MNDQREAEFSIILRRNRSWLISMAGLDAGMTDYSLRNDLLRLVELAELASPPGHKSEEGAPASTITPTHALPASTPTNPAAPPLMYKGWINFCKLDPAEARAKLSQIGVKVGEKVDSDTFTDCEATAEVMEKIDAFWGEFIWGMAPTPLPPVVRDSFLKFLEDSCPGDDAHDGYGVNKPLIERCGMCRGIYEAHQKAMKEAEGS